MKKPKPGIACVSFETELHRRFDSFGAKWRAVPAPRLGELKKEIDGLLGAGKIHPGIHGEYLNKFDYEAPRYFGKDVSVVVIAVPQEISLVTFRLPNGEMKAVIPPTYLYRTVRALCADALRGALEACGFPGASACIGRAVLPLKLLAVRSGLARYGKNNLAYVDGMGSFARLEAFFIGGPPDAGQERKPSPKQIFRRDADWKYADRKDSEALPSCEGCDRCVRNCPTQCMKDGEFVLDAGRCLTFYNESRGTFPVFVDPKAHNSLIGCVRCQTVCPENHRFMSKKTVVANFDEAETSKILRDKPAETAELADKLKRLDADEYMDVLCRNLNLLMNR